MLQKEAREFVNKSAASAASPDYVKFQAVIKSAASAASLHGGRASSGLDHGLFFRFLVALAAKIGQNLVLCIWWLPGWSQQEGYSEEGGPATVLAV